jgi:hypothetical protein
MKIGASIKSAFHSLLIFSVVLTYGIGGAAAFEIKHGHAHDEGHEHSPPEPTEEKSADHHHHHGEEHSHEVEEEPEPVEDSSGQDEEPGSSPHPHPHSHVFSLDTQFSFPDLEFSNLGSLGWNPSRFLPENENCPAGPFYELTKPPQVA